MQDRKDAISKEVEDRNAAIAAAIAADKMSIEDNSVLIETSVAADGKSFTIADSDKLTNAVAKAESAIQEVKGSEGVYATISATKSDTSYTIGASFNIDEPQNGTDKLTTAQKVKAYVEAKLNNVAHNNAANDEEVLKVVTSIANRADGTGFDVDYTNFEAIDDDDIDALFNL